MLIPQCILISCACLPDSNDRWLINCLKPPNVIRHTLKIRSGKM